MQCGYLKYGQCKNKAVVKYYALGLCAEHQEVLRKFIEEKKGRKAIFTEITEKNHPLSEYMELTEDELEMIAWRAGRGCHFDGGFLFASEYGKEVIQNDVPILIAEIRRLRGVLAQRTSDLADFAQEKV